MSLPPTHSTIAVVDDDSDSDSSDHLSDEQILQLLADAGARLREKAALTKADSFAFKVPKLDTSNVVKPYIDTTGKYARLHPDRLPRANKSDVGSRPRVVEDPVIVQQQKLTAKTATAGPDWYNLPRTELTESLKRDLQLLKMRNVLDPHRHYKKDNGRAEVPEYFQIGTIIEGPTEFYSGRLAKSERYESFADEVLAGEKTSGRFEKKFGDIDRVKRSGKKAHYKGLMAKRAKSFKR